MSSSSRPTKKRKADKEEEETKEEEQATTNLGDKLHDAFIHKTVLVHLNYIVTTVKESIEQSRCAWDNTAAIFLNTEGVFLDCKGDVPPIHDPDFRFALDQWASVHGLSWKEVMPRYSDDRDKRTGLLFTKANDKKKDDGDDDKKVDLHPAVQDWLSQNGVVLSGAQK
jgi:hypothetical protein